MSDLEEKKENGENKNDGISLPHPSREKKKFLRGLLRSAIVAAMTLFPQTTQASAGPGSPGWPPDEGIGGIKVRPVAKKQKSIPQNPQGRTGQQRQPEACKGGQQVPRKPKQKDIKPQQPGQPNQPRQPEACKGGQQVPNQPKPKEIQPPEQPKEPQPPRQPEGCK